MVELHQPEEPWLMKQTLSSINKQSGVSLVVSLLILLIATLIGTSTLKNTQLEEKMSSNIQNKTTAFQAAESALRAGEVWVLTLNTQPLPVSTCSAHPCVQALDSSVYPEDQNDSWWQSNSAAYTQSLSNVASPPRYIVEFLRFIPDTPMVGKGTSSGSYYYRVTARGTGFNANSQTVLQTTVARRY